LRPFLNAIGMHSFSFLSMPGVVAVGLGIKAKNNRFTGVPSLVFGVEKKLPRGEVRSGEMIPQTLDSLPTDVVQTGKIRFLGFALPSPTEPDDDQAEVRKQRMRPAQPGVSIGHYRVTAGTMGALVRGDFPGEIAILGNNHILANGTSGSDGRAFAGDPVLQPAPYDNGGRKDVIAKLYKYSPLLPQKGKSMGPVNRLDAALAIPVERETVAGQVLGLGKVSGTARVFPGETVFKSGRSTGVTSGPVTSVSNTLKVENDEKIYIFEDQIGTTAKSDGGDSGSLVVNRYGRVVGLLFAGSDKYTYVNPINRVFDYFGVSLFTAT